MSRLLSLAVILLLALPVAASAATVVAKRTLVVSEPPVDNAYLAGTDITVTVPSPADVLATGGTITLAGTVAGDALLAGGTIDITRAIAGDVRAAGGSIVIDAPVKGDLMVIGGAVNASTTAANTHIIGGVVRLAGSGGPTVVYGSDVYLSGDFAGDVEVIASDRLQLGENTHIAGVLKYDAPQEASIPSSAEVVGGVTYIGGSSYLPTVEDAKKFAVAGASVLFVVRVIAVLIAAGLLAGLFPVFTQMVADRALAHSPSRFILLCLLGFAILVATPVLILILAISFVGLGLAFLIGAAYILLLMLGYLYAGILAGAALGRGLLKREQMTWQLALLGMFVLYLIGAVPGIGAFVGFVLATTAIGSIAAIAHRFAFRRPVVDIDTL